MEVNGSTADGTRVREVQQQKVLLMNTILQFNTNTVEYNKTAYAITSRL